MYTENTEKSQLKQRYTIEEIKENYNKILKKCKVLEKKNSQLLTEKTAVIDKAKRAIKRARQDADNARSRAKRLRKKLNPWSIAKM